VVQSSEDTSVFPIERAVEASLRELLTNGEEPRLILQGITEVAKIQGQALGAELWMFNEGTQDDQHEECIANFGSCEGRSVTFDIIGEGLPCGLLKVFLQENVHDYDESLFITLAHHASITIERLRSAEKMQHFMDRLQVLNELNQLIATNVNLDRVVKSISRESAFRFSADITLVFILDQVVGTLVCEGAYGVRSDQVSSFNESDEGVIGQVLRTGGLITIPRITPKLAEQLPFVSQLNLSTLHLSCLEVRGESLGILVCGYQTELRVSEPERARIEEFSQAAAVAIANSRTQERLKNYTEKLEELVQTRTADLQVQTKKAEEANQAKSQFLANMSHELRTPLTAIVGYSSVLIEGIFGELNDKQIEALGAVVRSSDHLKNLIDDVLNLARIESGKEAPEPKAVGLTDLLKQSYKLIQQNALNKNHTLADFICPETLMQSNLWIDQKHIQQILINLLSNAVKYTPPGGKIWVTVEAISDKVLIEVHDTGVGIPDDKIATLFERFERGEDTYSKSQEGTGIGLNLTKRLVELNGGSIGARSEKGKGSTFWVMVPLAASGTSAVSLETQGSAQKVRLDGLSAIVVDDSQETREVVQTILSASGATVLTSSSVQEAFTMLEQTDFDVVITDLAMPNESGLVLIDKVLKSKHSKVPIIVMSACAFPQDRQNCLDAGATAFIAKPFKPSEIVNEVRKVTLASALKGKI
jgi:signal transduction histidine kinase/CheY-like chemotaxis protein